LAFPRASPRGFLDDKPLPLPVGGRLTGRVAEVAAADFL